MNAKSFKVPSICQCLVCHVIMHQFDCYYGCLFIRSKAKNEVSFLMIAIKAQWNISFNSFGFPVQFWNDYHHHHLPQQLIVTLKTPIKNVLVTTNSYFYQWPYLSSTPSFIQTVCELLLTEHQKNLTVAPHEDFYWWFTIEFTRIHEFSHEKSRRGLKRYRLRTAECFLCKNTSRTILRFLCK